MQVGEHPKMAAVRSMSRFFQGEKGTRQKINHPSSHTHTHTHPCHHVTHPKKATNEEQKKSPSSKASIQPSLWKVVCSKWVQAPGFFKSYSEPFGASCSGAFFSSLPRSVFDVSDGLDPSRGPQSSPRVSRKGRGLVAKGPPEINEKSTRYDLNVSAVGALPQKHISPYLSLSLSRSLSLALTPNSADGLSFPILFARVLFSPPHERHP